jgi:hypothetical protein
LTRILLEDLDIGSGTRSVRLADGSLATLTQISVPGLCQLKTVRVSVTNGASTLTVSGLIPAGARVVGVTTEILTTFGTTGGLTGFSVGDGVLVDRWGSQTTLSAGAQTDQGDFTDGEWPVYSSANDVVLSALSGTFDSQGAIEISVWYFLMTHRSA